MGHARHPAPRHESEHRRQLTGARALPLFRRRRRDRRPGRRACRREGKGLGGAQQRHERALRALHLRRGAPRRAKQRGHLGALLRPLAEARAYKGEEAIGPRAGGGGLERGRGPVDDTPHGAYGGIHRGVRRPQLGHLDGADAERPHVDRRVAEPVRYHLWRHPQRRSDDRARTACRRRRAFPNALRVIVLAPGRGPGSGLGPGHD
eukprot:scaffold37162_cov63-Phaeocystis_antarctica.AAC.1